MPTDQLNFDREERRRQRERRRRLRVLKRRVTLGVFAVLLIGLIVFLVVWLGGSKEEVPENDEVLDAISYVSPSPSPTPEPDPTPTPEPVYAFHTTGATAVPREDFPSKNVVLIELESGDIVAERGSDIPVSPASMTKILTLLVAAEQITDRTGTWAMSQEVNDYCFVNECNVVGYKVGETVPVEELFYGCIMCSGADATLGLAETAAGSQEAFVALMNDKLSELGLSDTAHFTNCVGLYDETHLCTMQDMAYILKAAWENEFCRQVMTTKVLQSAPTEQHPEGQTLINLFLNRISNQDTGSVEVLTAKTGWVEESGFCAASYGESADGTGYLCVTADSTGTWQSIYDHAELYKTYCD